MATREKQIARASWISFWGNLILAISKIIVGFYAGSLAVIGDGIDSSVDVVISIVAIVAAYYIARPPTAKYAYGFERADTIGAKTLSMFIFFAGGQVLFTSIKRLFTDAPIEVPSMIAVYVIVFSIFGKIFLSIYQYYIGKKVNSYMLIANGKNMKYDVAISITVLFGLISSNYFKMPVIDTVAAILVSLWVIRGAFEIFMETNIELMDGVTDPDKLYNQIFSAAERVEGVSHPHRARIRKIGNKYAIELHIEVDENLKIKKAHEIAHKVEETIRLEIHDVYDIMIHVEPKDSDMSSEVIGVNKNDVCHNQS